MGKKKSKLLLSKQESAADYVFDGLPKLLSPKEAAAAVHASIVTVYDWKQRPYKYNVPKDMIIKQGSKVLIRTDVLKEWFISRCA